MDFALYDDQFGYYARAAQRSGRAGDFFTSVDVGSLFGELLEVQLAEMRCLTAETAKQSEADVGFDLVEAGAGNGRLSADILRAAKQREPAFYESIRLHLVEASAAARGAQAATLAEVADRLKSSGPVLPDSFEGVLIANELLDALPVHQVVMREDGLREIYVTTNDERSASDERRTPNAERLTTREGPPSTPELAAYLARLGVTLEPGWRVEINLRAVDWIRDAARRLRRGFIILIDYGHEARELYSPTHSHGTLTTFAGHRSAGPEASPDSSRVAAAAWRTGSHRARRFHDRAGGGRSRRHDHARLSRSDVSVDGTARRPSQSAIHNPQSTIQDADAPRRHRQHAQGTAPRQRRRHADPSRMLVPREGHVIRQGAPTR